MNSFDFVFLLIISDQRSEDQLECLPLSHCELIYNTIFFKSLATGGNVSTAFALAGQNACYQTLISNQGRIFLLGTHILYEIRLRDWSERLDYYVENGKHQYEQALELAYSMLVGKAKGLTGKYFPFILNWVMSLFFMENRSTYRSNQTTSMHFRSYGFITSFLFEILTES